MVSSDNSHSHACYFTALLAACTLGGCASIAEVHPTLYATDRAADYPTAIVAATYVPPVEVDIALSGKTGGAMRGAGEGVLACSPALFAGPFGPFIFVPCAVLTGVVGGTIGAFDAAPKARIDQISDALRNGDGAIAQEMLAEKARIYLTDMSDKFVSRAGPEVVGPMSVPDLPEYRSTTPVAAGTLLELSLLSIRYDGSGKDGAPVCLRMAARGRKIDAATGTVIDALDYSPTIECQTVGQWLTGDGIRFREALENGYRNLAENLVDELYLIYYPPRRENAKANPQRPVTDYVLAPVTPQAPDMYLDFRSITKQEKYVVGYGGMHFVDVDSLSPTLSWEVFPRPFDRPTAENRFTNITYDVRIYNSSDSDGRFDKPSTLLHEVTGLAEPQYSVAIPLQPCSRYFWTVRARFSLNGVLRVTEWAGAYKTAGGEVSPSRDLYYPFRTPCSENTGV